MRFVWSGRATRHFTLLLLCKLLSMFSKFSALSIAFTLLLSVQAYSAREDLITQTKVSEQVRDFLLKKTERLKHQVRYL